MSIIEVNLNYKPHEKQVEFHKSRARFKIICAGRQSGKTHSMPHELFYKLYPPQKFNPLRPWIIPSPQKYNQHIWVIAPTYALLDPLERKLTPIFEQIALDHKKTKKRWILQGNQMVDFKSADNPNLVGETLDGIIGDECRLMMREVWKRCIQPCLIIKKGWGVFISTPKGNDWFKDLYFQGLNPAFPEFESFHFTSYDNPYADPEEIKRHEKTMGALEYRQEMLAEFIDSSNSFFKGVDKCIMLKDGNENDGFLASLDSMWGKLYACQKCGHPFRLKLDGSRDRCPLCQEEIEEEEQEAASYYMGFDPARSYDFSVNTILQYLPKEKKLRQVHLERFSETAWEIQKQKIIENYKRYDATVTMDGTGMGAPLCEDLQAAGVPVTPFIFSNRSKLELCTHLSVLIEHGKIELLDDPVQKAELENFEQTETAGGNWKLSAPSGGNDDCVMALALAAWGAPRIY